MDTSLILVKTEKGIEEIKSRSHGLSQALRALLIMADGSTSAAKLLRKTEQLPQVEEHLDWLIHEGFVEPVPHGTHVSPDFRHSGFHALDSRPSSFQDVDGLPPKQALIALTRELLGGDAAKVIERLEAVSDNGPELLAAVERCHKYIKLTIDEAKAERFLRTAHALLKLTH